MERKSSQFAYNGNQLEMSLEDLAQGSHERCHWCRKPFLIIDGKFQRFQGKDNHFYCSPDHGSAEYLKTSEVLQ